MPDARSEPVAAHGPTPPGACLALADDQPMSQDRTDDEPRRDADPAAGHPADRAAQPDRPDAGVSFDPSELAIVCSHFELGVIRSVTPFRRGSSRSPKVVLDTATGRYLLKRRAPGRDNPYRVALSHAVQVHLARRGLPVPRLVGTRDRNSSLVQLSGRVYELYEFAEGDRFDRSDEAAGDAGRTLAHYHAALAGFTPPWPAPTDTYHRAPGLAELADTASAADAADGDHRARAARSLVARSARAADAADEQGAAGWPAQLIHGDWHPGNLLFRAGRVVAVVDHDSVRLAPRAFDLAAGALHHALSLPGRSADDWPEAPDLARLRRFLCRYDAVKGSVLSKAELRAAPWLMIESLTLQTVSAIARTGGLGGLPAGPVLRAVDRTTAWIEANSDTVSRLVD